MNNQAWLLRLFILFTAASLLLACGDDDPSEEEFTVDGTWVGSYQSNERALSGDITVLMEQDGELIAGQATMTGAPCISSVRFDGTIVEERFIINLRDDADPTKEFTISGSVFPEALTMEAAYDVGNWGVCTGSSGTLQATRVSE